MDALRKLNEEREKELLSKRQELIQAHEGRQAHLPTSFPLEDLQGRINEALRTRSGKAGLCAQFDYLERKKFRADVAVKVIDLLQAQGAKHYIANEVPWIVEALQSELDPMIERIDARGIYVNLLLKDSYLLGTLGPVIEQGPNFGHSRCEGDRVFVVDYSSPNVAKVLHAGHIRSTLIGHVLCNLHEACGAMVYRVNHLNDFGGFGFLLEGYRRWNEKFLLAIPDKDKGPELYAVRRRFERCVQHDGSLEELAEDDREFLRQFAGAPQSMDELRGWWNEFEECANQTFERLENGNPEEVELWDQIIQWSLKDFRSFYESLDIEIDLTIPESFYLEPGNRLVDECVQRGVALRYTPELAESDRAEADRLLEREEITPEAHRSLLDAIEKDTGAIVVRLDGDDRLVVRRTDGRSIYSTRDLGAIRVRRDLFDPSDILYIVGQEQRVHFSRVFAAAEVMGLVREGRPNLEHIYFGFYIDGATKKKLSSREGSANVHNLLHAAIEYFSQKYEEDSALSEAEIDEVSRQLAVGCIVFNDMLKGMKSPVEMPGDDLQTAIEGFEKSGGAYVVYASCRARSIMRKFDGTLAPPASLEAVELTEQEAHLILKIQQFPVQITRSAQLNDPAILLRHIHESAVAYNSYYTHAPVLKGGTVYMHRLLLTAAFRQAMENALRLCHIECPERI